VGRFLPFADLTSDQLLLGEKRPLSIYISLAFTKNNLARHQVVLQAIKCNAYYAAGILWDRVFPATGFLTKCLAIPQKSRNRSNSERKMARPERFELPTTRFEVWLLLVNLLFSKECCEGARCLNCTTVHNHAQLNHAKFPQHFAHTRESPKYPGRFTLNSTAVS